MSAIERQCIVSRTSGPTDNMIRFVLDPDSRVVPDLKGNLPGRGVWITNNAQLVRQAVEKNLFARAFKKPVKYADELADLVAGLMTRHCLDYLGLARKAGIMRMGFTKVEAALKGDVAILLSANDGSQDGKSKLSRRARPDVVRIECFTQEQMSLALGRPNVIHAAITPHGIADKFLSAVDRLSGYRSEPADGHNRKTG